MSSALRPGPSGKNGAEAHQAAVSFGEIGSDAIVASQFYDTRRRSVCSDGEHRLMLAVLTTAISDYLRARGCHGRGRSDEVGAWINNKSPACGVFAYEEICESLGIDPDRLREQLRSLESRSVVLRLRSQPVLPASRAPRDVR
jgi:hypothetical protein